MDCHALSIPFTSNAHGLSNLLVSLRDGVQREMLMDLQAPPALMPRDQLDLRIGKSLRGQKGQSLVPEAVGADIRSDVPPGAVNSPAGRAKPR